MTHRFRPVAAATVLLTVAFATARVGADQTSTAAADGTRWKGQTHLVISAARANFPRLATWLLNAMYPLYPHRQLTGEILFTGSGYAIELVNVIEGRAQLAVTTPSAVPHMALKGVGLFSKPYPRARGFFKIGQTDPITLAVPASLGVSSFEEVIARKIPLKVATGFVDGDDATAFLFTEFLKASGTSLKELESWGGKVVPASTAGPALERMLRGEADSIFHEGMAMASPLWVKLNEKTPMRMLPISDAVIARLAPLGFRKFRLTIKKGQFPGVLEDVQTIDYSDWIVVGDASIPDDVAYNIVKAAAENGPAWSAQDQSLHLTASGAMGNHPVEPEHMWKDLGAPLHPGAERYYREKGLIKSSGSDNER